MTVEVFDCILELAVDGFMRVFEDPGAGGFRSLEMFFNVVDEYGEALRCVAEVGWR